MGRTAPLVNPSRGRQMFGRKLRCVAGTAMLAVTGGVLAALLPVGTALASTPTPAAEPRPTVAGTVGTLSNDDASLSALTVTGSGYSALAPGFAATTHDYQVVTADAGTASVQP